MFIIALLLEKVVIILYIIVNWFMIGTLLHFRQMCTLEKSLSAKNCSYKLVHQASTYLHDQHFVLSDYFKVYICLKCNNMSNLKQFTMIYKIQSMTQKKQGNHKVLYTFIRITKDLVPNSLFHQGPCDLSKCISFCVKYGVLLLASIKQQQITIQGLV